MPPTRHSTSTAHKESDQIPSDQNYPLGDYSFRIERSSIPGSTNDKIEAICTKGGKNARKSIQIPSSTKIKGWYVEANETEASVYIRIESQGLDTGPVEVPFPYARNSLHGNSRVTWTYSGAYHTLAHQSARQVIHLVASDTQGDTITGTATDGRTSTIAANTPFTYNGKTVYYNIYVSSWSDDVTIMVPDFGNGASISISSSNAAAMAWIMVYGEPESKEEDTLVGRFAIDLEDADGVGPGSDWVDPGDYDPDWEEGDPTHTLYVEVTGALSGRHNDPIEDPSYSYIPADKDTVKDYGCGGDGGHGGGGGAGASTVIVHKFATNQANSKEVTAIARRHGYGSGGGKGGKGGDGCILVYY